MRFDIQQASFLKRISAYILDLILLCVLTSGMMFLMSAITGYDNYNEQFNNYCNEYAEEYGIEKLDITQEEYEKYSKEEKELYDKAYKAFSEDKDVLRVYSMVVNLTMLNTTLAIFLSYAVLEFAIPLIFKNGQTVGKKIFGLGVMRVDGVRMNTFMLFVRTLLGKFTVETMIPIMLILMLMFNTVGIVGLIVIGLLLLLEIILVIATKNRTTVHDAFAQTVVIDLASQMIFDTSEALLEYKTRIAAEEAQRQAY